MTKSLLGNLLPMLLLLLAGCAASNPPATASAGKPGVGKGHWVTENAPTTGSMQPRRYWVSEEPGAATAANGSGVNSYGERSVQPGIGSTGGLSSSGGAGGGGGFGSAGGVGR